jgi:hypothetical protein
MTKSDSKKLTLRREALRVLTTSELQLVAGGLVVRTRRCAC